MGKLRRVRQVAGAAIMALMLGGCAQAAASQPQPSSAQPTPTPASAHVFTEESMAIKAGLTDSDFAGALASRLTSWDTAGGSQDTLDKFDLKRTQDGGDELLNTVASENGFIAQKALLAPDWKSNPNLTSFAQKEEKVNAGFLAAYVFSSRADGTGSVRYDMAQTEVSSTTNASSPAGRDLTVSLRESNNGDRNGVWQWAPQAKDLNGTEYRVRVKTTVVGGQEYLSDFVFLPS